MDKQSGSRNASGSDRSGIVSVVPNSVQFLKEVWQELTKVHWPTRKETYQATGVVLAVVGIAAIFLGTVDLALSFAMQYIMGAS